MAEHADRTAFPVHDQTDALPVAGDQLLDHGFGVVGGHFFVGGAEFVGVGRLLIALFGVKPQFFAAAGLDDNRKGRKSGGDVVFLRHGNANLPGGQGHRPLVVGSVQNLRRGHQTVADRLKFLNMPGNCRQGVGANGKQHRAALLCLAQLQQAPDIALVLDGAVQKDPLAHITGGKGSGGLGRFVPGLHRHDAAARLRQRTNDR